MVGFPVLVGVMLWRMNRAGTHHEPDNVAAFGWIYGACEADMFYYGWLSILRRTLFVIIARLPDTLAQSTVSVVLVAGLWLAHSKCEPYKDYFLDLLDMVLLGCLFTVAAGSLTYRLTSDASSTWLLCWIATLYCAAICSVLAFISALFHEAQAKALRTRVRLMYSNNISFFPNSLRKIVSSHADSERVGVDGKPVSALRLKLNTAVSKIGSRGQVLLGSLLNSLTIPAVRYGFAASRVNARRLQLLGDVTGSARRFLDHCEVHSYLSKRPQADFFRRLVKSFPEVLDVMCCLDDVSLADINALRKGVVFLERAVGHIRDHPAPPLHSAIRECDLGGIVAFLVTTASEYERKAFGEVLAGLIRGYVPVDFRPLTLSPRDHAQRRSIQIRASKFEVGVRVEHPARGAGDCLQAKTSHLNVGRDGCIVSGYVYKAPKASRICCCRFAGQLVDIDHLESRGKPYTVTFENGETHHCTPNARCVQ
jgi:hypothetical protein